MRKFKRMHPNKAIEDSSSRKLLERYRPAIIALIVFIHVLLCAYGAFIHSPTVDEPAYLVSGISHWEFGAFDLCKVSPPLVRLTAALPVMLAEPKLNWTRYYTKQQLRAEHFVGEDFLLANAERSFWLFTLGRWGCLPFSLIGAWVCYCWAKELFGQNAAFAALLLWCFSPNILAHAQLLTPDIAVTSLSLASCYAFWHWSRSPSWKGAIVWGSVLGFAVLAKTNAVILYPALLSGFFLNALLERYKIRWQALFNISLGIIVSLYIINLGYGFEATFRPLGDYRFFSKTFAGEAGENRFREGAFHTIPVPLPAAFIEGIDLQKKDFENKQGNFKTYFRGKWYDHGWWWYYLYVIGVKVPEGIWLLGIIGCVSVFKLNSSVRTQCLCYIILPGIFLFLLPCFQTGFGHSLRYALPALPFAFILSVASFTGDTIKKFVATCLLLWAICSSLLCYPHNLSYFNQLAGGPNNGHAHLLDGNLDWGQDLLFIQDWLKKHPDIEPVYVAYWGFLPYSSLGMKFKAISVDESIPPGFYILSVNYLHGDQRLKRPSLQNFLKHTPRERITPAIYFYVID